MGFLESLSVMIVRFKFLSSHAYIRKGILKGTYQQVVVSSSVRSLGSVDRLNMSFFLWQMKPIFLLGTDQFGANFRRVQIASM